MPITRAKASQLLNQKEMALYDESRINGLRQLDGRTLAARVTRARAARDRARDLVRRQKLASRSSTGSSGAANQRSKDKADLMADILDRFETRLREVERDDAAARRSATKAAKKSTGAGRALKQATKTPARKAAASGTKRATTRKAAGNKTGSKSATAKKASTKKTAKKSATKKTASTKTATKTTTTTRVATQAGGNATAKSASRVAGRTASKSPARTADTRTDHTPDTKAGTVRGGASSARKTADGAAKRGDGDGRTQASAGRTRADDASAPPRRARKRRITPEQALAQTQALLEAKQARDSEPKPWTEIGGEGGDPGAPGYQSDSAERRAKRLHAAEMRLPANQGSVSTRDRINQGKRDHRGSTD